MGEFAIKTSKLGKRYELGTRGAARGMHKLFEDHLRSLTKPLLLQKTRTRNL